YWAVDYWPNEATAWDDVLVGPVSGAYWPGEGILLYPGARVGTTATAPSMRLKYLRDGIQDYEYVELLKSKNQVSFINSVIRPIAADWHNWTQDQSVLEAARLRSGRQLDSLSRARYRTSRKSRSIGLHVSVQNRAIGTCVHEENSGSSRRHSRFSGLRPPDDDHRRADSPPHGAARALSRHASRAAR